MENKNTKSDNEKRFDSFLNKTIILSSKDYFRKDMNINNNEVSSNVYDEDFFANSFDFFGNNSIYNLELSIELNSAIKSLSAIEQSVIFLLYNEGLTQEETSEILKIWRASVDRIKKRALEKMKNHMEGGNFDE